jgi:hypothetical protein
MSITNLPGEVQSGLGLYDDNVMFVVELLM